MRKEWSAFTNLPTFETDNSLIDVRAFLTGSNCSVYPFWQKILKLSFIKSVNFLFYRLSGSFITFRIRRRIMLVDDCHFFTKFMPFLLDFTVIKRFEFCDHRHVFLSYFPKIVSSISVLNCFVMRFKFHQI